MRRISGARLTASGAAFSLWAPAAKSVCVATGGKHHAMRRVSNGWFETALPHGSGGTRYRFIINDETSVPDPGSFFQPDDIDGESEIVDHAAYDWQCGDWRGRPWNDVIVVETHVGAFTREGTYRAMIDKLDDIVDSGFTALELMPLADFPGRRNWGYDGVLWYAPDSSYGTPDDLKALIDAAHIRGLMIFLDVVYNHFGPEGNYLGLYAPQFFGETHTPWGNSIDYGKPEVRDFAVENAVMWLRDYRFDGLRLDAVHAIVGRGDDRMLHELSRAVGELARETDRHIHLVLENDDNDATLLSPRDDIPDGRYRAQWNDDYHHAWHVLLTREDKGYYSDYAEAPAAHLARALASGFAYQGEPSQHRNGDKRGEPSGHLPPQAFVNFIQNHDQIGNRALGDRLVTLAEPAAVEAALAITLLAPTIPLLFMGEEWGAREPFPFFCDFTGDLASAIRDGRKKEFAAAYETYGDNVPDPLDDSTFRIASLDWSARASDSGRARLAFVRQLIHLRRREIVPRLARAAFGDAAAHPDGRLEAHWSLGDGETLRLEANLSAKEIAAARQQGRLIWGLESSQLSPWQVVWQLEDVR